MFLLNSRLGLLTAAPLSRGAPLLPKLRGDFAEFLNEVSLARLSVFHHPTCVGLRYGRRFDSMKFFSAAWPSAPLSPELPPKALALTPLTGLGRPRPTGRGAVPSASFMFQTQNRRHGNVDPLSIGYAFRPGLRAG